MISPKSGRSPLYNAPPSRNVATFLAQSQLHVIFLAFTLAVDRIQKRLQKTSSSQAPPPFNYCHAPFSPLPRDVLLSKETLTHSVCEDMRYLVQQAK